MTVCDSLNEAVADAVGIAGDGGKTTIDALTPLRLLLVLDGAETHIRRVEDFAARVLQAAPHVALLVTSRVPVRLSSERRYVLAPLALPEEDGDAENFAASSAVRLFIERARAAGNTSDFTGAKERAVVTRLMYRLDGLPLALELAAARLRHLSVSEIEERLAESLSLLTSRTGDIPERHRTLLATLQWSYDLLSPGEQTLLRRVTVFADGFDIRAAEAINHWSSETLDILESLDAQGMLLFRRGENETPSRFALLRTVADFVRNKRDAIPNETSDCRKRHAAYFLNLAAVYGSTPVLRANEADAFDLLDKEIGNLRAAWAFLESSADKAMAAFAAHLADFLRRRGHTVERFAWIESALRIDDVTEAIKGRLLHAHALTLKDAGRTGEADATAVQLETLGESSRNETQLAAAWVLRGVIALRAKDYATSESFFDKAEVIYERRSDGNGKAMVANNRAMVALRAGQDERAETLLATALTICRALGDTHGEAYAHNNLGFLLQNRGQYREARRHYTAQLTYCQERRDTTGAAVSLFNIGEALLHENEPGGLPLLVVASELFTRLGHAYAEPTRTAIEKWAGERVATTKEITRLRRDASRRSVRYLRETAPPLVIC